MSYVGLYLVPVCWIFGPMLPEPPPPPEPNVRVEGKSDQVSSESYAVEDARYRATKNIRKACEEREEDEYDGLDFEDPICLVQTIEKVNWWTCTIVATAHCFKSQPQETPQE